MTKNFNWRGLLEDSLQQKYVLVVGDEIMLKEEICNGDGHKYLMQEYSKAVAENHDLDKKEFISEHKTPIEHFNTYLRELLSLKLFRVVITTTVDDLIERVMREVWGDSLRVINFYEEENDLMIIRTRNEYFETEPTLYYAFGKAESGLTFAYDEDDKLKIVSDWLNHSNDRFPLQFYNYIQTKKLLALGCKQEDWLFRFFWYSLRRNVRILARNGDHHVQYAEKQHMGTVAIEFDENRESDFALVKFIKRNGNLYNHNANEFTHEFVKKIDCKDETNVIGEMIRNNSLGGCFISYAEEDFNYAFNLYLTLKKKGFSVWIDNEKLNPGADYETRIGNAIKECKFFLPILSDTTQRDFNSGKFDEPEDKKRYYLKEWEMAVESIKRSNKHIIPVIIENFSVKSEAYKKTPWSICGMDKTAYKEQYSISKLIEGLREL